MLCPVKRLNAYIRIEIFFYIFFKIQIHSTKPECYMLNCCKSA